LAPNLVKAREISVIGAGAWGTTLAILLAEKGHRATLWVYEKELVAEIIKLRENKKYLPGFQLPPTIDIISKIKLVGQAEILFLVVPTQFLRSVAKKIAGVISPQATVVCASKGIELKTLKLPLEVLEEELATFNLAVLSGPNLSGEIARGLPAASVVASQKPAVANLVQTTLLLPRFRVYTSGDVVGVQLGGALKNIIAIAAGIVDGLKWGENAKAALLVRAMAEISRLGVALGARPETFSGLSAMGDLITTCSSSRSRNHFVGEQIAEGRKLAGVLKEMKSVAEGVSTSIAAVKLGKKLKVDLPIIREVYAVLHQGKDPYRALTDLMTRSATNE
jgi:glycerol-3-phosphate dehydrogenase (NAD(P)+)